MQIQGVVISYNANTKVQKRGGGTYDAWELVYRSEGNEVKTVAKPVGGLRFNPVLADGLAALKPGDGFTLYQEKNGQYWEPKTVEKGIKQTQEVAGPSDGNRSEVRGGKVTGSNYETPEERAKKQVVIVRQFSINASIEAFKGANALDGDLEKILDLAKKFEDHVYKDLTKTAKKYLEVTLKEVE